jgi:hypothetical protein
VFAQTDVFDMFRKNFLNTFSESTYGDLFHPTILQISAHDRVTFSEHHVKTAKHSSYSPHLSATLVKLISYFFGIFRSSHLAAILLKFLGANRCYNVCEQV